jgi:NADH dehydrogenase
MPPRGQAALEMALTAYRNILALIGDLPVEHFARDKGSLISHSRFSTARNRMGNFIRGRMAVEGRLARMGTYHCTAYT